MSWRPYRSASTRTRRASAKGRHRDGAARTRLQSHPCDEHHGHSTADGRDPGIAKLEEIAHAATSPSSDLSWQSVLKQPRTFCDGHVRAFAFFGGAAAALVHELLEARDEKRLLRLQRQLAGYKLLIIDELGYVPLSQTDAELLFEVFSQRYERGSTVVTSNLPFDEWTSVFGSERLTGALLDRLTHHVHILQMNGESYRLNQSKSRSRRASSDTPADNPAQV